MDTITIGSIIVIDGTAWTVESFRGDALAYAVSTEAKKAIWFDPREATVLGAGLWGLPGRIEPPAAPAASVVAKPAVADLGLDP